MSKQPAARNRHQSNTASQNSVETTQPAPIDRWLIDRYLDFLYTQRSYSESTVRSYRNDLGKLIGLFAGKPLCSLTHHDIRLAVSRLHAQGDTAKSLARRLSSWRSYFRWVALRGLTEALAAGFDQPPLAANPVEGIRAPKLPKRLPKALSVDQAQVLLDYPDPARQAPPNEATHPPLSLHRQRLKQLIALRDQAILELFYSAGLRLAELISLDLRPVTGHAYQSISWLDIDNAEVRVTGKGNKTRIVPIGGKAISALQAWLAVRDEMVDVSHTTIVHALFVGARGARITGSAIQQAVKSRARAAGIATNVHPHVLRHTFASHMLQGSRDLRAVQEMMGHASLASTQVYTSLDFSHLSQVYDDAHPRAKKK
ncbi:tyrosine recombinase XerC [Ampullimonas aquatilis]|uniref:tyrosine recombinase XerC n=1 Tax=Ampullimonas aquatilis TaxID=1341549 RepID=UPI003C719076